MRQRTWPALSIKMEYLFHPCPPFVFFSVCQRLLKWFHHSPPLLCFGVRGHLCPIRLHIAAVVLKVAEQNVVSEVDRVVSDVALCDHLEHFRPYRAVICLVGLSRAGLESQGHSVTLHHSSSHHVASDS